MALGVRPFDLRLLGAAVGILAAALLLALLGLSAFERSAAGGGATAEEAAASESYAELPLAFEPNAGRYGTDLDYVASSNAGTVALSPDGATLTPAVEHPRRQEADPIRLSLAGAAAATPEAVERLPGVVNDLRGDDPAKWQTEIPTFERIRYEGVYPGIDLDWHGTSGTLEYDFRLAPGADPDRITLNFGSKPVRIAPNGELVVGTGPDAIRQAAPVAYQRSAQGERQTVASRFTLDASGRAGFSLGAYDRSRALVIDPIVLAYSTYIGGDSADIADGIAVDSAGAAYVTGNTESSDFNTVGQIEGDSAASDVFVSKLNPAGSALAYSTYIGGGAGDFALGVAVDSAGAAYVSGYTDSTDFNTVGQIEGDSADFDVFVSKLNPAGNALAYSTYIGGDSADVADGIAVDSADAAYVTGYTFSTDYNTVNPIEGNSAGNDAFVSKLTPAGSGLAYSTYIGGGSTDVARGIAVDSAGAAYVTGYTQSTDFNTVGQIEGDSAGTDGFVSKLTPAGSALAYSTYIGGGSDDYALGIAVDSADAAYVAGFTGSTDFDTVGQIEGDSADFDAFVSKLTPAGSALAYSTYLGGASSDEGRGIAVDASGAAYVTGYTQSTDFNTVGQIEDDSAGDDAFVSKLTPAGSALAYSTYIGGASSDVAQGVAVDSAGAAYLTGYTDSTDFNAVGQIEGDSVTTDAFVSKIDNPACNSARAKLAKARKGLAKAKKKLKKAKQNGSSKDVKNAKAKVRKAKKAVKDAEAEVAANC